MKLLETGCHEPLKASVHGVLGAIALVCFGYNTAAYAMRRERHLARGLAFYGVLVAVEVAKVVHHCRAKAARSPDSSLTRFVQ
jgi:hypothetical protein